MITYIHKHKETSTSPEKNSDEGSKEVASNVVFLAPNSSKKDKARAKLLRAAQKIRW